ncbi:putative ATP-dependent RNA helicase DHX57 isoform X2 [Protopterus annectens]|uniref:putative ATP-dependent RNA helicase DHX57 isoform X2 n=1 Tax=Protopterus annectens TaxID=7888 RepID=UPI001CFB2412|nr:putative ATP-dependent RNA helicase DHX57 isoform X2 [Protopterus annectens]
MNTPGRRRGRPNRGGGRYNKPHGGRGSSAGSRKGSSRSWDDGDDFSVFSNASESFSAIRRGSGRNERRGMRRGGGRRGGTEGRGRRPWAKSQHSVPLQTLHMTSENQEEVKELLKELQGQEYETTAGSAESGEEGEEIDELDYRDVDQYWLTELESAELAKEAEKAEAAYFESDTCEPKRSVVSPFAIRKLCRYGFDKDRCVAALESCDGDVGASLEYLLLQCFSEKFQEKMVVPEAAACSSMAECIEQRIEEAFVLCSICGDNFIERIPNRVWTVGLQLEYLTKKTNPFWKGETVKEKNKQTSQQVCQYYLKGNCKFGLKCRFKHEAPSEQFPKNSRNSGVTHSNNNQETQYLYELEIRFPEGNKYPHEAALVAFSSTNDHLSPASRIHIAESLYEEALKAAESAEPVVYSLITYLEDEDRITELLGITHHKYSVPPSCLLPSSTKKIAPIVPAQDTRNSPSPLDKHLEANEDSDFEQDEKDEEQEARPVMVETESYVHIKKKLSRKYDWQSENALEENTVLCKRFRAKQSSRRYQSMLEERQMLPAWQEKENILDLLNKHQVLVVSGMTGCGKTTQVPQFILDDSLKGHAKQVANIICTQPRRISAISVAERVAKERAERLGVTVGYQIRLESVKSSATRLLYCTTGVLLRRLEGDTALQGVTHVIVDEVHERTEESDFLLLVLRDIMIRRPDLRILMMSATLNADLFSQYFNTCPTVHIPGHTFPVDQFFLEDAIEMTGYTLEDGSPYARSVKKGPGEHVASSKGKSQQSSIEEVEEEISSLHLYEHDIIKDTIPDHKLTVKQFMIRYKGLSKHVIKTLAAMDLEKINLDLIEALLEWIVEEDHGYPPGAILIFMPGLAEIKLLYEQLQSNPLFNNRRKRCVIYPLHSSLSSEEQQSVFLKPPTDVTKIVISTNIAETSITIDDVVYVIDSGRMKEKRYDPSKSMESLEDTWVSKANAEQRKGRAGRVASGLSFHLFTHHCFQHHLLEQQLPEVQRVPLEQLCLRIKILDMFSDHTLESVLSCLIEPPSIESLRSAKHRLQDLGALSPEEKLTPLGYHLASLPVDVRIGKLMLFGAIFRCLDSALTIAASLAFKSPFVSPWDKRDEANEKKLEFATANSDHLTFLQAYKGWIHALKNSSRAAFIYCKQHFLSGRVLQEIAALKRQFAELLSDIGFVKEGLKAKDIEKMSVSGGDGILEATGEEANCNADNIKLMSAMLCAALYPNVVKVSTPDDKYQQTSTGAVKTQPKAAELRFITRNDGFVYLHPSSVNFQVRVFESPYLVYHEKVKTSRLFIRDCSMVSVYPLVLFGGGQVNIELQRGTFVVSLDDGWICFAAASFQVAELVKELRWELDQLLQDKIKNPSMDLCTCPRGSRIIDMIVKLVTTQ